MNRIVAWLAIAPLVTSIAHGQTKLPPASKLPVVPPGFKISIYAAEPLLYKPTSLCFDAQGRAMVGQGPQYHLSQSIKKADSVYILLDTNNDGIADKRKVFATGFNSIQGLAWKGRDLYVANSPELTVVRDLNGDDVADEYIVIYTDLGNHEHALHGLVWGPDGRLYMSKGNSKGHNQPKKYGRVAPKAFRELWDVVHPPGAPDIPPARRYTAKTYKKTYHDPHDDWGREGGVLRCEPLGGKLEIVSRGMRNPWDIAFDQGFNILGTDNDQTQGDRIIMPFFGAHFGWGHRYSSHWTGAGNLPTVPVSGPMTSGSWAGITYYNHPNFPAGYRNVFLINDWLFGTYVFRPSWNGALRSSADGSLEPFIRRRKGGMIYRPTDIAFGPDGAIYSLGWGGNYHYEKGQEGSWLFRVSHSGPQRPARAAHSVRKLTVTQLINRLGPEILPARRVNAQDELVRRGGRVAGPLLAAIANQPLSMGQRTWAMWAVGRLQKLDRTAVTALRNWALPPKQTRVTRNLRIQAIRILGDRAKWFGERTTLLAIVSTTVRDPDPRIRFETMQALHHARLRATIPSIVDLIARERDRLVFYAAWQALRATESTSARRKLLRHSQPRVRLAALLGLQEDYAVTQQDVLALVDRENDPTVQSWALTFAMNPIPPAKLSNKTLRIEMEQTVPIGKILSRANAAQTARLRRLYLTMVSRASVREGKQQAQLLAFYRKLKSVDERALILPAAATTLAALPDLWEALAVKSLQDAAVTGIGNLHRLRVKQLSSSEGSVRATSRSLSSVDEFAAEIADKLLVRMEQVKPNDERMSGAIQALVALPLPPSWTVPQSQLSAILAILSSQKEAQVRKNVLRLLGKLSASSIRENAPLKAALKKLCAAPDALLYRDLQSLVGKLKLGIPVPKPQAATLEEVLSHLPRAKSERGRALFFDRVGGAGCANCHRVRGQGSELAPDLSGVGIRLTPKNLVQSILQPSAAITEGYSMHLVLTKGGVTHRGAIVRETVADLSLLKSDGTQVAIGKKDIEQRERLKQSVMPTGYELFGAEQLADLTAWLLTLRDGTPKAKP